MENKKIYAYFYCNKPQFVKENNGYIKVTEYTIVGEEQILFGNKVYQLEPTHYINEREIDNPETLKLCHVNFDQSTFVTYWTFTKSDEMMQWFKNKITEKYQNILDYLEMQCSKIKATMLTINGELV